MDGVIISTIFAAVAIASAAVSIVLALRAIDLASRLDDSDG